MASKYDYCLMDLREKLLRLFGYEGYVPMPPAEIMSALNLDEGRSKEVCDLLDQMVERREIARLKKGRLYIPENPECISGRIVFRPSGSARLLPHFNPEGKSYRVRSEDTGVAMHGDTVLARRKKSRGRRPGSRKSEYVFDPDDSPHFRVIRVIRRAHDTIIGTLDQGREGLRVIPDIPGMIQNISVTHPVNPRLPSPPQQGDKVVLKLFDRKQHRIKPRGEIIEVLGKAREPNAEFKAILHKYELNPRFPESVQKEVKSIPDRVRPEDIGNREDLRGLFTFTIDPDDAKDFDDALSLEFLETGHSRVGIHIADVSAYVKPNSALDREAQRRGNSTYLVGSVIPMLPYALSNGLCSLVESEDRLTKTCFITLDAQANILSVEWANTVICSNKRLTYKQAHALMAEDDFSAIRAMQSPFGDSTSRPMNSLSDEEMTTLKQHLGQLGSIAAQLRKLRFQSGSLDLDMMEVKIHLDEHGYATEIEKQFNDESHQLIEEFMLLANEQVARVMKSNNFPCIYRVHDEPEGEKLRELRETMGTFGVRCGNLKNPEEMARLLQQLKKHPQGYTLKIHILRSLKQAQYRAAPDGHYGLAKADYTHFTSPIRRYPDLIVHRVLDAYLQKNGVASAPEHPDIRYKRGQLESLGEHVSITERNSVDAERESVKIKLLEFYSNELRKEKKQSFKATVTEIKNHGLFIELLDSMTFGMIPVSTLDDDFYELNAEGIALIGCRNRCTFALGQTIPVQVYRVDWLKRQIDFRMAPANTGDSAKPTGKRTRHLRRSGRFRCAKYSGKNKKRFERSRKKSFLNERPAYN